MSLKDAKALGQRWKVAGHVVVYGVRDPAAAAHFALKSTSVVTTPTAAAIDADEVFLAVPWGASLSVSAALGDLAGKTVIEPSNAVKFGGRIVARTLTSELSGAELVQAALPRANVVKAFNQNGAEILANAASFAARPVLFIAGDDTGVKAATTTLAEAAGFEPVDAGPIEAARLNEDSARLWMTMTRDPELGRRLAFSLQKSADI